MISAHGESGLGCAVLWGLETRHPLKSLTSFQLPTESSFGVGWGAIQRIMEAEGPERSFEKVGEPQEGAAFASWARRAE